MQNGPVPVIDLFAGPGGLGEGFAVSGRDTGEKHFDIRLSIEKDYNAHQTLELRSFFRQFPYGAAPAAYYESLRSPGLFGKKERKQLFDQFPEESDRAEKEAMLAELGITDSDMIHSRISEALDNAGSWVLLGGPPCQAYSVVGRSRNKGIVGYRPEDDRRQYLYLEYLQIIADHKPAVFIMENVKGLLSATLKNERILEKILADLKEPSKALLREGRRINHRNGNTRVPEYKIYTLCKQSDRLDGSFALNDYIVKMENYGIPQARHRLILLGVRSDHKDLEPEVMESLDEVPIGRVLSGLPRLRSGLSKTVDTQENWISVVRAAKESTWFENLAFSKLKQEIENTLLNLTKPQKKRGSEFIDFRKSVRNVHISYKPEWFLDMKINGVLNHYTRGHIKEDLYRYLYAACFARVHGKSPGLADFPKELLPEHENARDLNKYTPFKDRFRVQVEGYPATTVTSHISKDGHYFIHPDPKQCRSLTVREAARIQTFPDNYFFCGPCTSQYLQVGNAVPPLLANNIAAIVNKMLGKRGTNSG